MNKNTTFILLVFVFGRMVFPLWIIPVKADSYEYISRGEAVSKIVQTFELQNREKHFLNDCFLHLEDCFFVFGAMSHFDTISFQPLVLYPDVAAGYRFYDDIVIATMLGLVHGYLDEKNSPFHPRALLTRIHALKIILGAARLLPWKEKFEIATQTDDYTWWYPRYINFARESGFFDPRIDNMFRPDEPITEEEFENFIQRALKLAPTFSKSS